MVEDQKNIARIRIKFIIDGLGEARGELVRFLAPITIGRLQKSLPLEGRVALGKQEVYFETPIKSGREKAKDRVQKGMIAFWPLNGAICIFNEDKLTVSPLTILGRITENIELFREIKSGTKIRVENLTT